MRFSLEFPVETTDCQFNFRGLVRQHSPQLLQLPAEQQSERAADEPHAVSQLCVTVCV